MTGEVVVKHWIWVLALAAAPLHAGPPLSLLGQAPTPVNRVVPAGSMESPRELAIELRDDGMGRFEAAHGTLVLAPADGRLRPGPGGVLELHADTGRVISFMSLGTHAPEGAILKGQVLGTVGDRGFATVLVRRETRGVPDPSKPGLLVPCGGGVAYVQLTSVSVRVNGKEPGRPAPTRR